MSEYIKREDALDKFKRMPPSPTKEFIIETLNAIPAADVVSVAAYQQVMWERDTAISQLAEYGIGFGEKKKDVEPVVRCRDCKNGTAKCQNSIYCAVLHFYHREDFYCFYGAHMERSGSGE